MEELRSGAMNDPDDWVLWGGDPPGPSPLQIKRIADAIEEDSRRHGDVPSTTPLEPYGSSGVPEGYGKWGDLA